MDGSKGGPKAAWTLVLASGASFMVGLDALVVSTALPTVREQLHVSASALGWTVSAYSLAFAGLILAGARLGDRYGRRRVFLLGMSLFSLASAACAAAPDAGALIAARALQGAGGGLAVPLTLVLVTEAYPPERRGRVIGVWGAITGLAVGAGPVVGGAIVQGLAWHWVFWVNVPIGAVVVGGGAFLLQESRGPARTIDWVGLAAAGAAVLCLVYAVLQAPSTGWSSPRTLGPLGAAAALTALFVLRQRHAPAPLVPPGLLTAGFRWALAARGALAASLFGGAFLVPQYLQLAAGYRPLAVGMALLPWTASIVVVAPRAGRWADRYGERHLIAVGLAFPTTASAALRAAPAPQVGIASGLSATSQQLGGVAGIALAVTTFASSGTYASPAGVVAGLHPALVALSAVAVLGALAALRIHPERQRLTGPRPAPVTAN